MKTRKGYRRCILCGTEYKYCTTCSDQKEGFNLNFDEKNCFDVCEILRYFTEEKINVSEAKEKLAECDLSKKDEYPNVTKEILNQIYGVGFVKIKTAPVEEAVKSEEIKVEAKVAEPASESVKPLVTEEVKETLAEVKTTPVVEKSNIYAKAKQNNTKKNSYKK